MNKNKRIKNILNKAKYKVLDSELKSARQSFLESVLDKEISVTNVQDSRIPFYSYLYKFIILFKMSKKLKVAIILVSGVFVFVGGSFTLAKTANAATPGDIMYPIDIATEKLSRLLIINSDKKATFEQEILEERALELEKLLNDDTDSDIIGKAVKNLEEQDARVNERLRIAEDNDNSDNGELSRVRERLEVQEEENLKLMIQIQEQYKL